MMNKEQFVNRLSRRAQRVSPVLAMEVLERAAALERAGRSIVHLEIGEPDLETPAVIREAGVQALRDGRTHYTHSLGHPELREAIAAWQEKQYGVEVSPDCIVVTLGSSGAMLLAFAALLEAGSEVLMTDPCYACYPKFVSVFDGVPVFIPVREEDNFRLDIPELQAHLGSRTRAILINSPSNPTGTLIESERLAELVEVAEGRALIISDEVYHGLVYQGEAHSLLEYSPDAIIVNSFSKLFAMTGWRLGYAILPQDLIGAVQRLQQNLFISAPDFAQYAAIAALTKADQEVEQMRCRYNERRQFVLRRLKELGFQVLSEPNGAFYVFVNVRRYTENVFDFAFQLLEEAGVAVTPGVDFGVSGEGFIRLSYANSIANIEEGLNRLQAFLGTLVHQ